VKKLSGPYLQPFRGLSVIRVRLLFSLYHRHTLNLCRGAIQKKLTGPLKLTDHDLNDFYEITCGTEEKPEDQG
jgi:hypothetical protein